MLTVGPSPVARIAGDTAPAKARRVRASPMSPMSRKIHRRTRNARGWFEDDEVEMLTTVSLSSGAPRWRDKSVSAPGYPSIKCAQL